MNTFYYLIEANCYLMVFYAFYKLALQNETLYSFNRFYLLGTAALSFVMPAIKISGLYSSEPAVYGYAVSVAETSTWTSSDILLAIYIAIATGFFVRFALRIYHIFKLINSGNIQVIDGINVVQTINKNQSFSFMNYLFIHPDTQKADIIIRHEQVHIRQLHSLDILFFELLQIVSWFNPLISTIQKEIKALHEFIADDTACGYEDSAGDYALFLIQNSYGAMPQDLSNTMFNQSLLKKRIMKLSQEKSPARARLKYLVVPILLPTMLVITSVTFAKSYGIDISLTGNSLQQTKQTSPKQTSPPSERKTPDGYGVYVWNPKTKKYDKTDPSKLTEFQKKLLSTDKKRSLDEPISTNKEEQPVLIEELRVAKKASPRQSPAPTKAGKIAPPPPPEPPKATNNVPPPPPPPEPPKENQQGNVTERKPYAIGSTTINGIAVNSEKADMFFVKPVELISNDGSSSTVQSIRVKKTVLEDIDRAYDYAPKEFSIRP